jgi:hypothetical protein
MKKKSYKQIKDIVFNNPRADRQQKDNDDELEEIGKGMTLYDDNNNIKMIDRIIRAYQAKKLMLKAQEIQQNNIKEERRTDLINRMVKGYNKNKSRISNKPTPPELSQSQKRERKLSDLTSRSSSWKGLENYNIEEGLNEYIRDLRKLYYSSKKLSFREWMNEIESLIDTL